MQYLSSNNPRNLLVFRGRRGRSARPVRRGAALRAALAVLALGAAPWNATAARGQAPDGAGEIRAAEQAIKDAMHRKDRPQLERLLAPDFALRGSPDIDRATWIRNAVTLCWGDRSDIEAFRAHPLGGTVVAAYELTFYVDPATCRPAVLRSLITDVWVQGADGWRLQVRHAGPAPRGDADVAAQFGAVPLPPPSWEVNSELSLVATGGNTSTRTLGLGADATHRAGAQTTRASFAFLTSEADEVTRARSLVARARHGVRVGPRLELFGRGDYARDRFAGIANRATVDGGLAYTASLPARQSLKAEGSVGFTDERRLDGTDLRFASATAAVAYRWRVAPGADFGEEVAFNGDLQDGGNWRGTSATALTIDLTRIISFKISHAFEYRNTPVGGFERTDMRTSAALVLSWQRRPVLP
jgi:putative salt-induced outer membrane protein YdiY